MAYTAAERLAKIETAIDALIDVIASGDGSPLYVAYMQNAEGGQTSYRDLCEQFDKLQDLQKKLTSEVADEADPGASRQPIVIVRRSDRRV